MADLIKSPVNISKLIYKLTVEILWNRLTTLIVNKNKGGQGQGDAANWFHVFRALRGRLKYRRSIIGPLPPSHVIHFDIQMCTYLLALNFVMPPHHVIEILSDQWVRQEWNALLDKGTNYKGLEDILPLLAVLWKAVSNKPTPTKAKAPTKQGGYFVRDVFAYFLQDKGPYGADVGESALKSLLASSSTLVSILKNDIVLFCFVFLKTLSSTPVLVNATCNLMKQLGVSCGIASLNLLSPELYPLSPTPTVII